MSPIAPETGGADRNEPLEKMANGVSSMLNDALTVFNGYSELILNKAQLDSVLRDQFEHIHQSAQRLTDLSTQLAALGGRQVLSKRTLDLNQVIRDVAGQLQLILGHGSAIELVLGRDVPPVRADALLLEQAMIHVANFAKIRIGAATKLRLATSRARVPRIDGECACLSITIRGWLVRSVDSKKLFQPFSNISHAIETGLRLPAVAGIIRQHHGCIEVDMEADCGTALLIYLPACTASVNSAAENAPGTNQNAATGTILLVEDDDTLRTLCAHILRQNGYRVVQATSADEAREAWKWYGDRVELLLTDMALPGDATGLDLGRDFKNQKPSLAVVIASGTPFADDGFNLVLPEGFGFIKKPYLPSDLIKTIELRISRKNEVND